MSNLDDEKGHWDGYQENIPSRGCIQSYETLLATLEECSKFAHVFLAGWLIMREGGRFLRTRNKWRNGDIKGFVFLPCSTTWVATHLRNVDCRFRFLHSMCQIS